LYNFLCHSSCPWETGEWFITGDLFIVSELLTLSTEPCICNVNPLIGELFTHLRSDWPDVSKEQADPLWDKSSS